MPNDFSAEDTPQLSLDTVNRLITRLALDTPQSARLAASLRPFLDIRPGLSSDRLIETALTRLARRYPEATLPEGFTVRPRTPRNESPFVGVTPQVPTIPAPSPRPTFDASNFLIQLLRSRGFNTMVPNPYLNTINEQINQKVAQIVSGLVGGRPNLPDLFLTVLR